MTECSGTIHISSAIISVLPIQRDHVLRWLAALPDVEVHHQNLHKIVIVLEGPDGSALGTRLAEIALWDGVLSASMVFEQIESASDLQEERNDGFAT